MHEFVRRRTLRKRNDARFDPGVALPFAPLLHQIFFQRGEAHHQRAAVAVRAQAHIHAEHHAFVGQFADQADQTTPELGEKFVVGKRARAVAFAVFRIEKDQVNVGRHVQLAPAQLAHADHQQRLQRAALRPERLAVLRHQRPHQQSL
ncbi:MAG: hypothetical protein FD134_1385 [Gallionellaceae bacterium]|nr:MAG: hypothetical protein FD134_1385 [Gallionellaceae bacterium]